MNQNSPCNPLIQIESELEEMVRRNNQHTEQAQSMPHLRFTAERERVLNLTEAVHQAVILLECHDAIAAEQILRDCLKTEQ